MKNIPAELRPNRYRALAVFRLFCLLGVVCVSFPLVLVTWAVRWEWWRALLVRFFHGAMRYVCGIRLKVEGDVSRLRPLMLVANHTSYLDIFILGSLLPLSFTPKIEIRSWPIIGFFCVLADCVFIERKPADMQRAQAAMQKRLNKDKVLGLFPEGTTGDGFHIKPFKSGFLNLAENFALPLQPVCLAYTHIGNTPLNAQTRELVAWIGEASLVSHLWRLLSFRRVCVTAHIYEVESMSDHKDRKELAKTCETVIKDGLAEILARNGVTG